MNDFSFAVRGLEGYFLIWRGEIEIEEGWGSICWLGRGAVVCEPVH